MKKLALYGSGGFAREVLMLLEDLGLGERVMALYESDDLWKERIVSGINTQPISRFDPATTELVLAVGSPQARRKMHASLPADTRYPTLVHPDARVHRSTSVGEGSIICAGSIVTCDIVIGRQVQLNLATTVGHDCRLEDFVTTAPAVNISGNCVLGTGSYFGTNACLREKINVAADAVVGMGAVVVGDLAEPGGIYVGSPARLKPSR
ncbi:NeuD/PglB/VioB family sugar acetyltransferase [Lysobacter enzymogenes]|jgi:sugar O-acyltransferase (sialic acid O-acetyltransferase NeuD family)|uniref:NeuD/PglB/VioB family sugar acetyltransferase n=1 Tax=Lysobacter enzymogenes TaxID=69 RepID=UPI0008989638|nr:NeuD/PglB/VioB family sugar acetyltransferase [Lysobacter enzymogenes]SDW23627.1 sugar O-acyltransferase, sialic acid O-acetyltransferase NeuD family [Lysobacter enzymogenes]